MMPHTATPAPWTQSGWTAQITAWVAAALASQDARLTGALEPVRVRPWSALRRAPTTAGLLWLKVSAPAMRHEAALLDILRRVSTRGATVSSTGVMRAWHILS